MVEQVRYVTMLAVAGLPILAIRELLDGRTMTPDHHVVPTWLDRRSRPRTAALTVCSSALRRARHTAHPSLEGQRLPEPVLDEGTGDRGLRWWDELAACDLIGELVTGQPLGLRHLHAVDQRNHLGAAT